MGYLVVSPCFPSADDAASYSAGLPYGYQIVGCTASSPFVELTPAQKLSMFQDGAALGGGISVVLVAVFAVMTLKRAI